MLSVKSARCRPVQECSGTGQAARFGRGGTVWFAEEGEIKLRVRVEMERGTVSLTNRLWTTPDRHRLVSWRETLA